MFQLIRQLKVWRQSQHIVAAIFQIREKAKKQSGLVVTGDNGLFVYFVNLVKLVFFICFAAKKDLSRLKKPWREAKNNQD